MWNWKEKLDFEKIQRHIDRPPIIHKNKRRAKRALNKPKETDIVTAGPGISGKGSIEKKNNKEGSGEKTKESWCWHNGLCQ